jgi:hypothetical protein
VSQQQRPSFFVNELKGRCEGDPGPVDNLLANLTAKFGNVFSPCGSSSVYTIRESFGYPRTPNSHTEASGLDQQSFRAVTGRVGKKRRRRSGLPSQTVDAYLLDTGVDGRKTIAGELEAGAKDDCATHVDLHHGFGLTAFPYPGPLNTGARTGDVDPIQNFIKREMTSNSCVDRASERVGGHRECLHPRKAGPCRSATHLCQVGTTTGNHSVQVEFPQSEIATQVQHRNPQTPIGGNEAASGSESEPRKAVGRKEVEGCLNPVSSTTTDQQVGLAAYAEGSPRPEVYPLVKLGLTPLSNVSEVLFEVSKGVLHDFFPPALDVGTTFACYLGAGHTTTW